MNLLNLTMLETCEMLCGCCRHLGSNLVTILPNARLPEFDYSVPSSVVGGVVCAIPLGPGGAPGSSYGGAYAVKLASSEWKMNVCACDY
jgi:hypothetical protein